MSNQGVPYYYNYMNVVDGTITPSTMHIQDNKLTHYFARYLLQKVLSVYEWSIPDNWDKDYFLYTLFCRGFVGVLETKEFGVIPQHCSLYGYNVFYRPTDIIVANPLLRGMRKLKLGKQCEIIKLQPDYGSIMDMVMYYAGMMALSSETATINLVNSKLSYVAFAQDKAEAETFKKMFDEIYSGEPACVIDKKLKSKRTDSGSNWQLFNQNVGQNYIVGDILSDLRKWENMFNTDIGIANANTDKKERLITAEVEANNQEVTSKASLWLEQMQEAVANVNAMFGLNITVDWRNNPNEEVEETEVETDER